jgi:large subunit ribosomal protein L25
VERDALRAALKAGARHKIIHLSGPGAAEGRMVLIKEMQMDPGHLEVRHIDFFQPTEGRPVHVRVPVVFQGEEALLRRGHILEHHMHEVQCECLPSAVPEAIVLDVGALAPGQHITLGGLPVMPGVRLMGQIDQVVVTIEAPRATMIPGEGEVRVTAGE